MEYMPEREVAKMLNISMSKLQSDRSKGRGLPYLKISKRVIYSKSDILEYLSKHKVDHDKNNEIMM